MRKIVWTETELRHIVLEFKDHREKFPYSGLTTETAREAMRRALPPTRWRRFSSLKQTPRLTAALRDAMEPEVEPSKIHTFRLSHNLHGGSLTLVTLKTPIGNVAQELHLRDTTGGHDAVIRATGSRFTPSVLRVLANELEEFLK